MKSVNIGICGVGTVGGGTLNVLRDNAELITARAAARLQVIHVGARHDSPACDLAGIRVSRDIFEVARDPEVDIPCGCCDFILVYDHWKDTLGAKR